MPGLFTCYLGRLAHFSTKYVNSEILLLEKVLQVFGK